MKPKPSRSAASPTEMYPSRLPSTPRDEVATPKSMHGPPNAASLGVCACRRGGFCHRHAGVRVKEPLDALPLADPAAGSLADVGTCSQSASTPAHGTRALGWARFSGTE